MRFTKRTALVHVLEDRNLDGLLQMNFQTRPIEFSIKLKSGCSIVFYEAHRLYLQKIAHAFNEPYDEPQPTRFK